MCCSTGAHEGMHHAQLLFMQSQGVSVLDAPALKRPQLCPSQTLAASICSASNVKLPQECASPQNEVQEGKADEQGFAGA